MSALGGLDVAPCGYFAFDDARRIVDVNETACGLLEHTRASLVGQPITVLLPIATRIFFQTHVFPVLALGERADELYLTFRTSSGGDVPVLLNVSRAPDAVAFTNHCAFMSVQRRHLFERELVTAKHEAERSAARERAAMEELRNMQAQLALQERLASVGTLAAGVAHEINNPLAYVAGNLEIMNASLGTLASGASDLAALLRDAREGVDRIRSIVDSLRTLSRVDDSRRVPVSLAKVVDLAVRMAGNELRHKAHVTVECVPPPPAPPPFVVADEGRLGQVMLNLLVNAAQALPDGRYADNRVDITISTSAAGAGMIEIADNGPGIPAAIQNRIFDPFFTTKPVGKGTGLGLAMVHGIVTSLGGAISVESSPGKGARFRLTLPLAPPPPDLAPSGQPLSGQPTSEQLFSRLAAPRQPPSRQTLSTLTLSEQAPSKQPLSGQAPSGQPLSPMAPPPNASPAATATPPDGPDAPDPPDALPKRVLIVDDDERVARLLARALRGHDVVLCSNGREAVSRCEAGEAFDLVLCDLMMPEMTGMEVHAAFHRLSPALAARMIFLTGGAFTDAAQDFLDSVPNRRVDKPFSLPDLLRTCDEILSAPPPA